MAKFSKNQILALLFICMFSSFPDESFASFEAKDIMKMGMTEQGIQMGFWQAFTAFGHAKSANRSAMFVLPQFGYVATDVIEAGAFSGAVEILAEPIVGHFYEPFSASLFGCSIVGRYNFLTFGKWMPYWDFGVGLSWTDLAPRIPEQSTKGEFLLETGPGLAYFLTQNSSITGAFRYHHISNGDIGDRNSGINAFLISIGFSYYIDFFYSIDYRYRE